MRGKVSKYLRLYHEFEDVIPYRRIKKLWNKWGAVRFKKNERALLRQLGEYRDEMRRKRTIWYKLSMLWKRFKDWVYKIMCPKVKIEIKGK